MKPSVQIVKRLSKKTGNFYYVIEFKCGDFVKDFFPQQVDSTILTSFMKSYEASQQK